MSRNPMSLHGLLQGELYLFTTHTSKTNVNVSFRYGLAAVSAEKQWCNRKHFKCFKYVRL
jgi:hypothetical protein